jgi:hypothetical protein
MTDATPSDADAVASNAEATASDAEVTEENFVEQLLRAQVDTLIARVFPTANDEEKTELRQASMERLLSTQEEGDEAFAPVIQAMGVIAKRQGLSLEEAAPMYEEYMDKLLLAIQAQKVGQEFLAGKTTGELKSHFAGEAAFELDEQGQIVDQRTREDVAELTQFLQEKLQVIYPQASIEAIGQISQLCMVMLRQEHSNDDLTLALLEILDTHQIDADRAVREVNLGKLNEMMVEFSATASRRAMQHVIRDLDAYQQAVPAEDTHTLGVIKQIRDLVTEGKETVEKKNWERWEQICVQVDTLRNELFGFSSPKH